MAVVCPAVLAASEDDYQRQIHRVTPFARRIQIDLSDGVFTPAKTIEPAQAWWPVGIKADLHLMYLKPQAALETVLEHKPHLIIIHVEAKSDVRQLAALCRRKGVNFGMAILSKTATEALRDQLDVLDHVLIFSGDLGRFGGKADLTLLDKAGYLKKIKPELEIGWDGGINDQNVTELVTGGIDVLNAGGYIQKAKEPARAWQMLKRIADETGTT